MVPSPVERKEGAILGGLGYEGVLVLAYLSGYARSRWDGLLHGFSDILPHPFKHL